MRQHSHEQNHQHQEGRPGDVGATALRA
jgi:hypothetical protein